jgi:hypothetical protein
VYFLQRWGDGDQWFTRINFEMKPFQLRYFEQLEDLRMRLGNYCMGKSSSSTGYRDNLVVVCEEKIYNPPNREIVLAEIHKISKEQRIKFASLSDPDLPFPFYSVNWNARLLDRVSVYYQNTF